jgi:hypothetical protein
MLKTLTLFLVAASLQAGPVTYSVLVNTGSIFGQLGNIDFQFNPRNASSDPAFVTISAFSPAGGLAGSPSIIGNVTGTLPLPVRIDNTSGLNDYTQGFTFGSALSFLVAFNGPALTAPSGTATAGNAFGFSLFNSDFSAALLTIDPDGFLVTGQVDTLGRVTMVGTSSVVTVTATPEPRFAGLLAVVLAGLAIGRLQRRRLAAQSADAHLD